MHRDRKARQVSPTRSLDFCRRCSIVRRAFLVISSRKVVGLFETKVSD